MRFGQIAFAAAIWLALAGAAQAEGTWTAPPCTPAGPPPPETMRPTPVGPKPVLPKCVNLQTHMGVCKHGEIERYNADIVRYNSDVSAWNNGSGQYVDALNSWSRAAARYAQCEVDNLNAQMPR